MNKNIGLSSKLVTLYNETAWIVKASILENKIKANSIAGLFSSNRLESRPIVEHTANIAMS